MRRSPTVRSFIAVVVLFASAFTSGCETIKYADVTPYVEPGMTRTDVQSIMGPPHSVWTLHNRDVWQFCHDTLGHDIVGLDVANYVMEPKSMVTATVWFVDGRVTNARLYDNPVQLSCQEFFQAFRWQDQ
ncbi:MAG: outer membrane protein assembly factor BamE domain-containing protein [Hyphomicrobiaceae bacterium]